MGNCHIITCSHFFFIAIVSVSMLFQYYSTRSLTIFVSDIFFLALPNVAAMCCLTPATVERMMISHSIPTISIGGSSTCTVDSNR